jgi:type II secretory pathway pseudopilin PulG
MESRIARHVPRGFTRTELLVILLAIAALLLLFLPALPRGRRTQLQKQCLNNLNQAGFGFRYWADRGNRYPMLTTAASGGASEALTNREMFRAFQCLSNDLSTPSLLVCPADTRIAASNFASLQNSNISYFVGGDADESNPRLFMAGDRNWETNGVALPAGVTFLLSNAPVAWGPKTIHRGSGNIVLSDGSVQTLSSSQLRAALLSNGNSRASNMLVFP